MIQLSDFLHAQMETLRKQLEVLKDGLKKSKVHCRTVFDKDGFDTEIVDVMIKKAEVQPQNNPHLQRVYQSWMKVQEKRKEILDAESIC